MGARAHVLCPIDFSDPSRAALRYARAIAGHFEARLTVVTVNDPLLTEVAELRMGSSWMAEDAERELRRFVAETFEHSAPSSAEIRFEVAEGKPAPEILRVARERGCDLIVMGTHGMTGVRKMFFGSTTERVLRETGVPVLLTPAAQVGPLTLDDVKRAVRRVLAPVDLSPATAHQVQVAGGLAEALDAPLLLLSVIEPVHFPLPAHLAAERRCRTPHAGRTASRASGLDDAVRRENRGARGVRQSRRGDCQDGARSPRRPHHHGAPRVSARRPSHGLGDVSRPLSRTDPRAGAPAGSRTRRARSDVSGSDTDGRGAQGNVLEVLEVLRFSVRGAPRTLEPSRTENPRTLEPENPSPP